MLIRHPARSISVDHHSRPDRGHCTADHGAYSATARNENLQSMEHGRGYGSTSIDPAVCRAGAELDWPVHPPAAAAARRGRAAMTDWRARPEAAGSSIGRRRRPVEDPPAAY